jgi:hypothetical protein
VYVCITAPLLLDRPQLDGLADCAIQRVSPAETAGTRLEGFPTAPSLAAAVVEALDARAGGGTFRVVESAEACYTHPIIVTATENGRDHHVWIDPDTGGAMIHSKTSAGPLPRAWPARGRLALADEPHDRLIEGVPALLAKRGIASEAVTLRNPSDLVFTFETEGRRWHGEYNIQTGAISARSKDEHDDDLSAEWSRYRMNAQHDQARWGARRPAREQEPNPPHQPLPPQLQLVVQLYAGCYFTLIGGLLAYLAITSLKQRWQRDDASARYGDDDEKRW